MNIDFADNLKSSGVTCTANKGVPGFLVILQEESLPAVLSTDMPSSTQSILHSEKGDDPPMP